MPPLPSPGKVMKLQLLHTMQEDTDVQSRFFMSYTGSVSVTDLNTLLATLAAAWATNFQPLFENQVTLVGVAGVDLSSETGAESALTTNHQGTNSGAAIPANACSLIHFGIARRYRGGHPRVYMPPGPSTELNDAQTWLQAFVNSLTAAWTNMITALTTSPPAAMGTLVQVNVSYYNGFTNHTYPSGRTRPIPNPRVTPVVDNVTLVLARNKIGTQRRRTKQSA